MKNGEQGECFYVLKEQRESLFPILDFFLSIKTLFLENFLAIFNLSHKTVPAEEV